MSKFVLSDALIEQIEILIENKSDQSLLDLLQEVHFADIAEILHELTLEEATYIIKLLDSEKTSDILTELDSDLRDNILRNPFCKRNRRRVVGVRYR